jgi:hypothetical protein
MDLKTQQLNILMETMRDVIKAKTCPDWVARKLADGVKRAKTLGNEPAEVDEFSEYTVDYTVRPFEINECVVSNVKDDKCLYRILEQSDPIDGVNLYTLRIEKGNKANPPGYVVHNVPETMLNHIK